MQEAMNNALTEYKRNLILNAIRRILSLVDKDSESPTYGCFDRTFWHYKFITDYPSARYQESVYALALVYLNEFSGNIFYKNSKILELIKAGIKYWVAAQNSDGSFSEAYPNEHSYVTTAFSTYAITETILSLKETPNVIIDDDIKKAIRKSADWLINNRDLEVTNHEAGASAAVFNAYLILRDEKYKDGYSRKLTHIIDAQNEEGWFREYEGYDPGYQSVTLSFLASSYRKIKDPRIFNSIEKGFLLLEYSFHPDGSFAGQYGSRFTKFFYPSSCATFLEESEIARRIYSRYLQSLAINNLFNLSSLDDRYFVSTLNDFISAVFIAGDFRAQDNLKTLPSQIFRESGLTFYSLAGLYLIINAKKGGVIKVYSMENGIWKPRYFNAGYILKDRRGKVYSSLAATDDYSIKAEGNSVEIICNLQFANVKYTYPLCRYHIPFRLFNYTFGKSNFLMKVFNSKVKQRYVTASRKVKIYLNRRIKIRDKNVQIKDNIVNGSGIKLIKSKCVPFQQTGHVSSSKYFTDDEISFSDSNEFSRTLNSRGNIEIKYENIF